MADETEGMTGKIGDWLGLDSRRVEGDLERFKQFVEERGREPAGPRVTESTPTTTRGQPVRLVTSKQALRLLRPARERSLRRMHRGGTSAEWPALIVRGEVIVCMVVLQTFAPEDPHE